MKPEGAPFVLVYHGTLARRLGLDIAIEAVAKSKAHSSHRAADHRRRRRARKLIAFATARPADVVFSDGFVPVKQIPEMIHDADVGVMPLRMSSDGHHAADQAARVCQMGIPCIVPKSVTIGRYFDAEMVQFFEAENVGALASAIRRLYDHPVRQGEFGREATARFGRVD